MYPIDMHPTSTGSPTKISIPTFWQTKQTDSVFQPLEVKLVFLANVSRVNCCFGVGNQPIVPVVHPPANPQELPIRHQPSDDEDFAFWRYWKKSKTFPKWWVWWWWIPWHRIRKKMTPKNKHKLELPMFFFSTRNPLTRAKTTTPNPSIWPNEIIFHQPSDCPEIAGGPISLPNSYPFGGPKHPAATTQHQQHSTQRRHHGCAPCRFSNAELWSL